MPDLIFHIFLENTKLCIRRWANIGIFVMLKVLETFACLHVDYEKVSRAVKGVGLGKFFFISNVLNKPSLY